MLSIQQNERCSTGRNLYKDNLIASIEKQWESLCECKPILTEGMGKLGGELFQSAQNVLTLMDCLEDIIKEIDNEDDPTNTINVINELAAVMLILMPSLELSGNNLM